MCSSYASVAPALSPVRVKRFTQRQPRLSELRLQVGGAAQRLDGGLVLAQRRERQPEFIMRVGGFVLGRRQIAQPSACGADDPQGAHIVG